MISKKRYPYIAAALCFALLTSSCMSEIEPAANLPKAETPPTAMSTAATEETAVITVTTAEVTEETQPPLLELPVTQEEPQAKSVTFTVAGDNLIHTVICTQAQNRAGGEGYDFSEAYEHVAPLVCGADISILNQETIVNDVFPPSNYPCFSTPTELGDYMIDMGFDAFSIANNHLLDKGEDGLFATLDYWDRHPEAVVCGAYRSEEDMNNIRTITSNGVTFSLLGYMEHTNGLRLPQDSEAKIVYLSELDTIKSQIEQAKEISDVVILNVHWGVEVTNEVTEQQKSLARQFVEWGADVIVGTQPHTVQTMEYITREDGSRGFVFYCLGNFISAMENPYGMMGMIGNFTVSYDPAADSAEVTDVEAIPIVNHYDINYRNIAAYPFSSYTKELALQHGCVGRGFSYELAEQVFDENIPKEYLNMEYMP